MKHLSRLFVTGIVTLTLSVASCNASDGTPGEKTFVQPDKSRQGPPSAVVGRFAVDVPPARLEAGEETFPCFIAPLELEGASRVVGGASITVSPGMHHGNITARPKTGEGFRPCPEEDSIAGEAADVLNGGAVLFGSTTQVVGTEWRTFPDGMGFPIDPSWEIVLRLHYLNASSAPVEVAPKYEWLTIDESTVTTLLGPFIWRFGEFKIPPHARHEVEASCFMPPQAMNIVSVMPHMHKLGTRFTASFMGGALDGQLFLDSPGYNPDGLIYGYEPALEVKGVDGFHFSCEWENTFDKSIVEGVGDNEMCMLFGYAYPYEQAYSALANDLSCLLVPPPLPEGWKTGE